jgi:hypothetical protein
MTLFGFKVVRANEHYRLTLIEREFHAFRLRVRHLALRYHTAAGGTELHDIGRRVIGGCGCDLDSAIADISFKRPQDMSASQRFARPSLGRSGAQVGETL